jgi:hypothetical protein
MSSSSPCGLSLFILSLRTAGAFLFFRELKVALWKLGFGAVIGEKKTVGTAFYPLLIY